MKILYIEDEPSDAQLVALYIKTTPHHLILAENTEQARTAFVDNPDLILADVMLGHARLGYSLIREFRSRGCKCPIVAVTALTTPQDVQDCQAAGVDYILHKPFGIEQLAQVIGTYKA